MTRPCLPQNWSIFTCLMALLTTTLVVKAATSAPVTYVLEPFESLLNKEGFVTPPNLNLTMTSTEEAAVGSHALKLQANDVSMTTTTAELGWFGPTRPHLCHGADEISLQVYAAAAAASTVVELWFYDDSDCTQDCSQEDSLNPHSIVQHVVSIDTVEEWQELKIDTSSLLLDLGRIRGWKITLQNWKTGSSILVDHLACHGNGDLFGVALNYPHLDDEQTFDEGTWRTTAYQSPEAATRTQTSFVEGGGGMQVDYSVEIVEAWGGYTDFHALAVANGYYDLSQATDIHMSYNVTRVASEAGQVQLRVIVLESSHCETDGCDADSDQNERWYSFHAILDTAGPGDMTIPLIGSTEAGSPLWMTGWAGIVGDSHFDKSQIKGLIVEFALAWELGQGAFVDGAIALQEMSALDTTQDVTIIQYVMEPFEYIDTNTWATSKVQSPALFNVSIHTEDFQFGSGALDVSFDGLADGDSVNVQSIMTDRPHNCMGANAVSVWYRNYATEEQVPIHIRLLLLEDTDCVANHPNADCANAALLKEIIIWDETITPSLGRRSSWQQVQRNLNLHSVNVRRLRGWKLEFTGSSGRIMLDNIACVGDGSMLGAPFDLVGDNGVETFRTAVGDGTWEAQYYQSQRAQNASTFAIANGQLSLDYAIEQAENWGGFTVAGHVAPGPAFYDLSQANGVSLDYNVRQGVSSPGHASLRLILADGSDCFDRCDEESQRELWYSFHAILEEAESGHIIVPLVGDTEPGSSFWLTGWAGNTGNSKLDLGYIKGYSFELSLDGELGMGSLVTGALDLSNFVAVGIDNEPGGDDDIVPDIGECVTEEEIYFDKESGPFTQHNFRSHECCEICEEDPNCLYVVTSDDGHCFTAPHLDYQTIKLVNTRHIRDSITTMWMDYDRKRGDFCEKCDCIENERKIDCRGKELLILPKTFDQSWSPTILDLRENPKLHMIGEGSLRSVSSTLEEIYLSDELRALLPSSLEDLQNLRSIHLGEVNGEVPFVMNAIKTSAGSFHHVCCNRGTTVTFDGTGDSLTFCDMVVDTPGIDSTYHEFEQRLAMDSLDTITPSSYFMAEAAESAEKCAAYCSIDPDCQSYSYDGRFKNAEHLCYHGKEVGYTEYICCDADHYADANQTLPGWISGLPPRTRHQLENATVVFSPVELFANESNSYTVEYQVSLGSTPIRGAVWIEPTLVSSSMAGSIDVEPSKIALYDDTQSTTVRVHIHEDVTAATVLIRNAITTCDEAFNHLDDSDSEMIFISVTRPEGDDENSVGLAVGIPIAVGLVFAVCAFVFVEHKRRQNDSIWKVRREELVFGNPPEVIGHGTFGLVLLAEYRGTQVAVKRVIPPKTKTNKGRKEGSPGADSSSNVSSTGSSNNGARVNMVGEPVQDKYMDSWAYQSQAAKSARPHATKIISGVSSWNTMRKEFIKEMRYLSKLRHPCITTVMGAVIGNNVEPMLVMEYMDHGSLHDLLHNHTMVIEGEILLPILRDISQGVRFLHSADPQVLHGDLKAQNILVDGRFRAKVADFGLSQKRGKGGTGTPLWMAPELLRFESGNTSASDVYSFGIILYEVYSRGEPYEGEKISEVLRQVIDKDAKKRPPVPPNMPTLVASMMEECLRDDPSMRPTFEELDIRLKREEVDSVEPSQIFKKASPPATHISLFDIFPKHIAEALRDGRTVEAEHRDCVTIFFSDIVKFTEISSSLSPHKVANLLDRLYTKFDALSQTHDIFKVETIGDAYMAVTNLVKDQEEDHAKRMAEFAIDAVKAANDTMVDPDDPEKGTIHIRAGFHSGSVVADVVGTRNPRYCLFGDTVNTASRMESNSKPDRIHCSFETAELLREQRPDLPLTSRGTITIKGKGEMHTYWVNEVGSSVHRPSSFDLAERSMLSWAKESPLEVTRKSSRLPFASMSRERKPLSTRNLASSTEPERALFSKENVDDTV